MHVGHQDNFKNIDITSLFHLRVLNNNVMGLQGQYINPKLKHKKR